MKVKRMIKELEKFNQDAEVRISGYEGNTVLFVLARDNDDKVVWLETEEDCDLGSEIAERFDEAILNGEDETDVYRELIETGISVECLRKYAGDEAADHMKKYCEEHGIIG